MNAEPTHSPPIDENAARRRARRWPWPGLVTALLIVVAVVATVMLLRGRQPPRVPLELHVAAQIALPGNSSRFDYASLDASRGLLFIAHLGDSQLIDFDVRHRRVVRTIPDLPGVHGVLVVPARHRVYTTATNSNEMVILDEDTGARLATAPTGAYPDGLAYDPVHATIWTTNETGGSETVLDADTGTPRGTVALGAQVGNVAYDPAADQMLVDVQSANNLAVIDPVSVTVTRRVALPGCDHDHGLALDPAARLAFVACDGNATLLTVDLDTWQVIDKHRVGRDPDVLAYDPSTHRLYVATESGWLTIFDEHGRHLTVTGSGPLAPGAHVVAVDPGTHRSYFPVPAGSNGRPTLLAFDPAS
jgi:DNA-binding beta-propeller fold protein YncE